MRILITGSTGFVGRHLAVLLKTPQVELHGTSRSTAEVPFIDVLHQLDLRDPAAVQQLFAKVQPDQVYHLAAQAFVPRSFDDPWETLESNLRGLLNIFQACLTLNQRPKILVVGSAAVYGIIAPEDLPITENTPFRPNTPYGMSKAAQDMMALQYHISHQFPVIRVHPFNHLGPGQHENYVAPAFAMQIARIETGQQPPQIHVGDLTARRDFTDVRDVVRAYSMLMATGEVGQVYNVASGKAYPIQAVLNMLLEISGAAIDVVVDEARLRPSAMPVLLGDATRLHEATGWQPQIPFRQTLADILKDCRQCVHNQE